jgi:hypothetical protein
MESGLTTPALPPRFPWEAGALYHPGSRVGLPGAARIPKGAAVCAWVTMMRV